MHQCQDLVLRCSLSTKNSPGVIKKRHRFKEKEKCDEGADCGVKFLDGKGGFSSFEAKMKRLICYFVFFLCFLSCSMTEMGVGIRPDREDIWTGRADGVISDPYVSSSFLAFSYEKGYDWRNGQEGDSAKCSLTVFYDGVPALKVPLEDSILMSADPARHRLVGKVLISEYSTDKETILLRNGVEVLRFSPPEILEDIVIVGKDLHTLGTPVVGTGFRYRVNGALAVSRSQARTFHRMYQDNGQVCFAFQDEVQTIEGNEDRYYSVVDGKISCMEFGDTVSRVEDIAFKDSEPVYILRRDDGVIMVESPDTLVYLFQPPESEVSSLSFMSVEDKFYVKGYVSFTNKIPLFTVWENTWPERVFEEHLIPASFAVSGGKVYGLLNSTKKDRPGIIFSNGKLIPMPEGYTCVGDNLAAVVDSVFYAGLSSTSGGKPILKRGSLTDTLDMNGFVSAVHSIAPN